MNDHDKVIDKNSQVTAEDYELKAKVLVVEANTEAQHFLHNYYQQEDYC